MGESQQSLFRPSKKRKTYRQRARDESPEPATASSMIACPVPAPLWPLGDVTDAPLTLNELIDGAARAAAGVINEGAGKGTKEMSISEILRLRNLRKPRGGVEFKVEGVAKVSGKGDVEGDDDSVRGNTQMEIPGPERKFAPQTGTVLDVDKHMTAYIDSELAKRRLDNVRLQHSEVAVSQQWPGNGVSTRYLSVGSDAGRKEDVQMTRQPATLGKLMEIDLGDEVRHKNVRETEKARRRLNGEELEEESPQGKPVGKVRLRPDGKPWRGRKRRGSEDIKRDRLVEDILRENRLEIYDDTPATPMSTGEMRDQGAADDRIAEEFRKEYLDAASQKQQQKKKPVSPRQAGRAAGGRNEDEVLKGPKLGGSRNTRAAFRDALLKAAAEKK